MDVVKDVTKLAPGHTSSLLFAICPYLKRTEKRELLYTSKEGYPRRFRVREDRVNSYRYFGLSLSYPIWVILSYRYREDAIPSPEGRLREKRWKADPKLSPEDRVQRGD